MGSAVLVREGYQNPDVVGSVIPLKCQMGALELLAHCVNMGWMAIIVSHCLLINPWRMVIVVYLFV